MAFKKFFLIRIIGAIRQVMPGFVRSSILTLMPVSFLLSIFEIFGLLIIIPVIQIILKPEGIHENRFLSLIFKWVNSPSETVFVAYMLSVIVLFFILKNTIVYWASLKQTHVTFEVAARLTILQFQKYLYQPYRFHVSDNSSVLLRKIIEIPYNFTGGIMLPVVNLINEIVIAALIISGILLYNPLLFISIILFVTPFFLLYASIYKKQLKSISDEREKGHSDMFRKGRQSIEGFREILLFDKFKYFVPEFNSSVNRFSKAIARLYHLNSFSPKITETLAIVCVLGIFLMGIVLQHDIEKLASFLAAFAIAAYRLIPSINKMVLYYNNIKSSEFVFDHFRTVDWTQHSKEKISTHMEEVKALSFKKDFQLKNISFSFDTHKALLHDVNLTIQKGEIIGIIGKSGSGKSTLINIMLGLYEPSSGQILLDGKEITHESLMNWYKTISFVPQSPVLVEGSISENIAFGVPLDSVDSDKLKWSVENSGLQEFIQNLPNGLQTHIGDKSLNISGGQKQGIAIARALYHNGQLLIFDEATSSLDYETERFLTESIKRLSDQSYTIVIIAHRMETLKYCDRIYKITNGRINDPVKFSDVV